MLDFLFATDSSMERDLLLALGLVVANPGRPTQVFSGDWGCLATAGQPYPCFDPVETDQHILVVLGGPLPRHDFAVATGVQGEDGTRWILDQWKVRRQLRWDADLVGHFAVLCVDKKLGHVEAVTDINGFVPLCATTLVDQAKPVLLGSHVDALAVAAGRVQAVDEVSIADFMTHSTVTYPYTLYRDVRQLCPAAMHKVVGDKILSEPYWTPAEQALPGTLKECAVILRDEVVHNIERICAGQDTVGVLFSAGEDSRVVASVARRYAHTVALTFSDTCNREVRIAKRTAQTLNVPWTFIPRAPAHYLDWMDQSLRLTEFHRFFRNAHVVGLLPDWPRHWRILGGHLSDVLLKGHYIPKINRYGIFAEITVRSKNDSIYREWPFYQDVMRRRTAHLENLVRCRPQSADEWTRIWPASHLLTLGHLAANRRSHAVYEPFVDSAIVKLSASFPMIWKINRKLFYASMKPLLRDTRHVPHPRGIYPYYGLGVNVPVQFLTILWEKMQSAMWRMGGRTRPNQGPWPVWSDLVETDIFRERLDNLNKEGIIEFLPLWTNIMQSALTGTVDQRFRALQLLKWADWRMGVTESE